MATNYPTSKDDGTSLPYPAASNFTDGPSLAGGQDNQNDAIIALQTKLGITASTPAASKLLIGTGAGTSTWSKDAPTGTIVGTSDSQTLTNKILTSPTINSPIISNATITTDLITGYTDADSGAVFGITIANSVIATANSVPSTALVAKSVTAVKIETQQAWQAVVFQNSWVNYGSGFADAAYMKDSLGFVHFRGCIKNGVTTIATTICNLPVGYRPEVSMYYPCVNGGGNVFGAFEIQVSGNVNVIVGASNYMMLGNEVIFKAA